MLGKLILKYLHNALYINIFFFVTDSIVFAFFIFSPNSVIKLTPILFIYLAFFLIINIIKAFGISSFIIYTFQFSQLYFENLNSFHRNILKSVKTHKSRLFNIAYSFILLASVFVLSTVFSMDFLHNDIGTVFEYLSIGCGILVMRVISIYLFIELAIIIILPILKIEESLTPHQSKEETIYEELRTRFAFHNITKDVRNLKSHITILKHEEPQLLTKLNTLDDLTDMVVDTLNKFRNTDSIRTKNPFFLHELFDNFLILNKIDLTKEKSDLQIEYQKPEYKDLEIHQIFYEVYQVLNNLIDNARKAIAHSDRKEIQILTLVSQEGFVDFRVSDTGVGIDTKARNRVFDIGYSTTNGDGLGLLFVQTTLKRFGGEIQLLPTAISGFSTTFEVRIPTQKG
jgi:hypothetical protein